MSRSAYRLRYSGQPSSVLTPFADTGPAFAVSVEVAVVDVDTRAVPPSAVKVTSTSLRLSVSVSTCQYGLMFQLNTNRSGGS